MSLQCGIVGLPNVGKSTLFNALTKAGIAAENYPFCTIEPNTGVVEVPDPRLAQLAEIVKPERAVPAIVEFVDIAGLVAGASTGEGLGNKFLAHIRETDAIVNVVRCFEDDNVIHVANKVDPIADIEVIQTELCLADLAAVEKAIHRVSKTARSGDKESVKQLAILEKCQAALNDTQPVRTIDFSKEEQAQLKQFFLITAKPAMFVANVAEDGFENNPFLDRLQAFAAKQKAPVVAICAKIEAELSEMDDADRLEFLKELGQDEPGLNRLIRAAYQLLGLQTYFTAGEKEVRAWTIHVGDTGPQAAGVIHTDFEKGYIRAQTIAFADYLTFKGEQGAKDAGKMRAEGKDYVVKDGDVMNFLFFLLTRKPSAGTDTERQAGPQAQRLSKRLAAQLPCSRSDAERYIAGGWVRVDGQVVEEPMARVTDAQAVVLDPNARLEDVASVTLVWHKPAGVALPEASGQGSQPLPDALAALWFTTGARFKGDRSGVRPLKMHLHHLLAAAPLAPLASGLMVWTQNPGVARKIEDPGAAIEHEWLVTVADDPALDDDARREAVLQSLQQALFFDGWALPRARASWQSERRLRLAIKHTRPGQVAHLCERAGLSPSAVHRLRLGRIGLGGLASGQWRYLMPFERF